MNLQRFLVGVSILNLGLLIFLLMSRTEPALASPQAPVLRGSALEIVDAQGRVRASIKVQPAETFKPTGRKYPETVMLRLIDPKGRPEVKIGASVEGGGLALVGETDATQVHLQAEGDESSLRLSDRSGKTREVKP
ncbi:MAG TPA: hypothetical protein VFZ87_04130 [Gemmatimonadales bacterium]